MLHSVVCICEYEYSHLHSTLCSARQYCRATPFKEKKSSYLRSQKKGEARKRASGPHIHCNYLLTQEILEEILGGNNDEHENVLALRD